MKKIFWRTAFGLYIIAVAYVMLSSCTQAPASAAKPNDTHTEDSSATADSTAEQDSATSAADASADSAAFQISDYDGGSPSEAIGVFYNGGFYGWVSQIKIENEINSYIAQGEYIGESKVKQIVYEGSSDEPIIDGDEWYPDSDLECNGLNAGTPLYCVGDYIVAVYDTPVEVGSVASHKSDGTEEEIGFYVYGHLDRRIG